MTRIASELPRGLTRYKVTQPFTGATVPQSLLRAHSTKAGAWGLLRVLSGQVRYCLDNGSNAGVTVAAGGTAVIEPEMPHHVELLDRDSSFLVEFYRTAASLDGERAPS